MRTTWTNVVKKNRLAQARHQKQRKQQQWERHGTRTQSNSNKMQRHKEAKEVARDSRLQE
jgi:Tfp pilus assembly protein PilE